jgi:poly(3-hydroxyalkanoate) depolymerase
MPDWARAETVSICGQELRFDIRRGRKGTTPLLLLNGIGAALELFQPLTDALPPDIEVIRFDVPGTGGSPSPRAPYPFWALACLTTRLLDTLGYTSADVLGFSWGGALAQQLALQHPARCRRLILLNTGTGALMIPGSPSSLARLLWPPRTVSLSGLAAYARELSGGEQLPHPAALAPFARALRSTGARDYWYLLSATVGWSSLPWLPLLAQPTLIMAGSRDPLVPLGNARIMHALIPRSQLYVYPGGHLGLLTRPRDLAHQIAGFTSSPTDG